MANDKQLEILRKGPLVWNQYREGNPMTPDLGEVFLIEENLSFANLAGANLRGANMRNSSLWGVPLKGANLTSADLTHANLTQANLAFADLFRANISGANFNGANLSKANVAGAECYGTLFVDVDLKSVKGLESCRHRGPSFIDDQTLAKNRSLPVEFLRGCGLPDFIIDNRQALYGDPIQFYSCFLSYSSVDEDFAKRLYNDLQGKGIRCWFAPEDLKTGDRFRDRINEAIRVHDKLLLILSENSIQSDWVETEVEKAFAEERRRSKDLLTDDKRPTVLFPVRVDEEIRTTKMAWADHIRNTRHIGDFTQWKDHDSYEKAFTRLLRDLRASGAAVSESEKEPSA